VSDKKLTAIHLLRNIKVYNPKESSIFYRGGIGRRHASITFIPIFAALADAATRGKAKDAA
jgi:hypothetical protein